jgi:hypothetical protein
LGDTVAAVARERLAASVLQQYDKLASVVGVNDTTMNAETMPQRQARTRPKLASHTSRNGKSDAGMKATPLTWFKYHRVDGGNVVSCRARCLNSR